MQFIQLAFRFSFAFFLHFLALLSFNWNNIWSKNGDTLCAERATLIFVCTLEISCDFCFPWFAQPAQLNGKILSDLMLSFVRT